MTSESTIEVIRFTKFSCPNCGVVFTITTDMENYRRRDGHPFYCPNGHSISFDNSLEERLKAEQQKVANLNVRNVELAGKLERAETAKAQAVEKKKRIETRVSNGVCPCCNRTFQNLGRHMQTKHKGDPSYKFNIDKLAMKVTAKVTAKVKKL